MEKLNDLPTGRQLGEMESKFTSTSVAGLELPPRKAQAN